LLLHDEVVVGAAGVTRDDPGAGRRRVGPGLRVGEGNRDDAARAGRDLADVAPRPPRGGRLEVAHRARVPGADPRFEDVVALGRRRRADSDAMKAEIACRLDDCAAELGRVDHDSLSRFAGLAPVRLAALPSRVASPSFGGEPAGSARSLIATDMPAHRRVDKPAPARYALCVNRLAVLRPVDPKEVPANLWNDWRWQLRNVVGAAD